MGVDRVLPLHVPVRFADPGEPLPCHQVTAFNALITDGSGWWLIALEGSRVPFVSVVFVVSSMIAGCGWCPKACAGWLLVVAFGPFAADVVSG